MCVCVCVCVTVTHLHPKEPTQAGFFMELRPMYVLLTRFANIRLGKKYLQVPKVYTYTYIYIVEESEGAKLHPIQPFYIKR